MRQRITLEKISCGEIVIEVRCYKVDMADLHKRENMCNQRLPECRQSINQCNRQIQNYKVANPKLRQSCNDLKNTNDSLQIECSRVNNLLKDEKTKCMYI